MYRSCLFISDSEVPVQILLTTQINKLFLLDTANGVTHTFHVVFIKGADHFI